MLGIIPYAGIDLAVYEVCVCECVSVSVRACVCVLRMIPSSRLSLTLSPLSDAEERLAAAAHGGLTRPGRPGAGGLRHGVQHLRSAGVLPARPHPNTHAGAGWDTHRIRQSCALFSPHIVIELLLKVCRQNAIKTRLCYLAFKHLMYSYQIMHLIWPHTFFMHISIYFFPVFLKWYPRIQISCCYP